MADNGLKKLIETNLSRREQAISACPVPPQEHILALVGDIESEDSLESVRTDPYWPKWNSPWWKMTLLHEMGLDHMIPRITAEALLKKIDAQYLHFFPTREEELPDGCDPIRHIICHCALGIIYGMFSGMGMDVDSLLPWAREWFVKYQMPDGGYNCDEGAYLREKPRSSFLSSIPPLETLLLKTGGNHTPGERDTLDRGARYFIDRKLCRSISKGMSVIKRSWFHTAFPRYYKYDILRGLTFVTCWAEAMKKTLPVDSIAEALAVLNSQLDSEGRMAPGRNTLMEEGTCLMLGGGKWEFVNDARMFDLLEEVSRIGQPSIFLTREWYGCITRLAALDEMGLLST
jgi:hypothetical protein